MTHVREQTEEQRSAALARLIRPYLGARISNSTLHKIDDTVKRYGDYLRRQGVDFPQLVAVFLPERGHMELVRADLEHEGIQMVVRNLAVRFPDIDVRNELVPAINRAFPDYRGAPRYIETTFNRVEA